MSGILSHLLREPRLLMVTLTSSLGMSTLRHTARANCKQYTSIMANSQSLSFSTETKVLRNNYRVDLSSTFTIYRPAVIYCYTVCQSVCVSGRSPSCDSLQIPLSQLAIRKQGSDELAEFCCREVHQMAFIEQIHDVGLEDYTEA